MDRAVVINRRFMPAPHPIELRERAVRAYLEGTESMLLVAARFKIAPRASNERFADADTCSKKRLRPFEQGRLDVPLKRASFIRRMNRVDLDRLVFLAESGANLSMGRTHAWIPRGQERVERGPMNWGTNLTIVFKTANRERFVSWVRRRLYASDLWD